MNRKVRTLFTLTTLVGAIVLVFFLFPGKRFNTNKKKVKILTFFGAPGAGKKTLSGQCKQDLGYKVLSTGKLCRKHMVARTRIGKHIESLVKKGQLIPDEMITSMVEDWLRKELVEKAWVILDGYPRTSTQAEMFVHLLQRKFSDCDYQVILFDISENEVVKRLSRRLVCENKSCQKVYLRSGLRWRCGECSSKLVQRKDDREEVVRKRIKRYEEHRERLVHYYKRIGIPVQQLKVSGLSINGVFEEFKKLVKK